MGHTQNKGQARGLRVSSSQAFGGTLDNGVHPIPGESSKDSREQARRLQLGSYPKSWGTLGMAAARGQWALLGPRVWGDSSPQVGPQTPGTSWVWRQSLRAAPPPQPEVVPLCQEAGTGNTASVHRAWEERGL